MKKSQDFVLLGIDDITGADIRLLRQILGLSTKEIAEIAGYHPSTIHSMECSFYRPKSRLFFALAHALKERPELRERVTKFQTYLSLLDNFSRQAEEVSGD